MSGLTGNLISRIPDKQWNIGDLIVSRTYIFTQPLMFSQHKAMISIHDQHGVVPHIVFIHIVQKTSQILVTHGQEGRILTSQMLFCSFRITFLNLAIWRPVKERAIVIMRIQILIMLMGKERLMRIKTFYLKHPVVAIGILFQEFHRKIPSNTLRLLLLTIQISSVYPVLSPSVGRSGNCILRNLRLFQFCFPLIAFLASDDLPGTKMRMIIRTAFFPVMIMITDQMTVNSIFHQILRQGIIVDLQRSPASRKEIMSTRMHLTTCRHARKTSNIAILKFNRVLCKSSKIRSMCPIASVWFKHFLY